MKRLTFAAAILLVFAAVRGFQDIDHESVRRLYDEDARAILGRYTGGTEADEPQLRPLYDDFGKPDNCSSVCENYECKQQEIPEELKDKDNYLIYESTPIHCRWGARIFLSGAKKFLNEDLWDCCRKCNREFYQCVASGNGLGVKEKCLRESYTCMCTCLRRNPLP